MLTERPIDLRSLDCLLISRVIYGSRFELDQFYQQRILRRVRDDFGYPLFYCWKILIRSWHGWTAAKNLSTRYQTAHVKQR